MGIGSFAEKRSVPPAVLAGLPDSISFEDGAALPVTALTAEFKRGYELLATGGVPG